MPKRESIVKIKQVRAKVTAKKSYENVLFFKEIWLNICVNQAGEVKRLIPENPKCIAIWFSRNNLCHFAGIFKSIIQSF